MLSEGIVADFVKRLIDILASFVGFVLLSLIFLMTALLIKFDSPGPVFYRSQRVGKGGKLFILYKFRSMIKDADRCGPGITSAADERITPIGRMLRRTKIDELPQLINVLKGDMSIVGPRPEDPRYVSQYTPEQRQVLSVRPGITSPASLAYRNEERLLTGTDWEKTYITKILPEKIKIDLAYLSKQTFLSDICLIIQTILSMLR